MYNAMIRKKNALAMSPIKYPNTPVKKSPSKFSSVNAAPFRRDITAAKLKRLTHGFLISGSEFKRFARL